MIAKAILTDLGDVVVHVDQSRFTAELDAAWLDSRRPRGEIDARFNQKAEGIDLRHRFEQGLLDGTRFREAVCALFGRWMPEELFKQAFVQGLYRNEPVIKLWQRVHARYPNVPLVAVTDIDPWRLAYIVEVSGLPFTHVAASYEVGQRKPHRAMFERAIQLAGFAPNECLFVDNMVRNVIAAQECGLLGHVYDPTDEHRDKSLEKLVSTFIGHL